MNYGQNTNLAHNFDLDLIGSGKANIGLVNIHLPPQTQDLKKTAGWRYH